MTNAALTLSLALVLVLGLHVEAQWWLNNINVKIYNKIESKVKMQVHCKEKHKDLGVKQVAYDQFYEFGFDPSFWGNTLYFCGVVWDGRLHWFHAFKHKRDFKDCMGHCIWYVKEKGPCLEYPNGEKREKCYGWN